jgi:hypothetical protein
LRSFWFAQHAIIQIELVEVTAQVFLIITSIVTVEEEVMHLSAMAPDLTVKQPHLSG